MTEILTMLVGDRVILRIIIDSVLVADCMMNGDEAERVGQDLKNKGYLVNHPDFGKPKKRKSKNAIPKGYSIGNPSTRMRRKPNKHD